MKDSSKARSINVCMSILLILVAFACNQWTIGILLAGGQIDNPVYKILVWVAEACMAWMGVCLYRRRNTILIKHYVFSAMILVFFFAFTVLCDHFLALLGFPSELKHQFAHPPNFRETRSSIDEFEYEFVTNSQGLRYKEIPLEKTSPGEKRIFVIGDSYAEGHGVEQGRMFSSLLESSYQSSGRNIYFINGGLSGTGPIQQMGLLFNVGIKYDIDAVLICVYPNDVCNMPSTTNFYPELYLKNKEWQGADRMIHIVYPKIHTMIKKYEARKKSNLNRFCKDIVKAASIEARKKGLSENAISSWARRIPARLVDAANRQNFNASALVNGLLRPDYWSTSLDIDTPSARQRVNNMKATFDFIVNKCRAMHVEVYMIFVPCRFMYDRNFHSEDNISVKVGFIIKQSWLSETTNLQKELKEWAGSRSVAFFDLTDTYRKARSAGQKNLNYRLDGHWNALGHEVAAEAIKKWFDKVNKF